MHAHREAIWRRYGGDMGEMQHLFEDGVGDGRGRAVHRRVALRLRVGVRA